MDSLIEKVVSECVYCQAVTPEHNASHPVTMTPLPDQPWQRVSVDTLGPLPSGQHLLVVIDDYTRYPVVEVLEHTSCDSIILKLHHIFS